LSLPQDYFVYAGRKEVGKNVPLLCDWFARHARRIENNTKLVFIGGGDNGLLNRSEDFVDLGFVSEAVKQRVISRAKAVINLSENESFSIVLMEGWLLGAPAIVSANCAVMKGHALRSNGGLYVADADEFSATLEFLESHEDIRRQLATNGRQYVSQNFSFDVVLARYLATLAANGHEPYSSDRSPGKAE
jgi:glycosyltransferase involved in cell wall biosynthesis